MRQPGSTFKPFVYSAALAKGMTASTMINDAPISLPGKGANGSVWSPKNSDGRYSGYITLRQALTASKIWFYPHPDVYRNWIYPAICPTFWFQTV